MTKKTYPFCETEMKIEGITPVYISLDRSLDREEYVCPKCGFEANFIIIEDEIEQKLEES